VRRFFVAADCVHGAAITPSAQAAPSCTFIRKCFEPPASVWIKGLMSGCRLQSWSPSRFKEESSQKVLGPFLSVEDPDTFFVMRAFPDLQSREPLKAQFYDGELWKANSAPRMGTVPDLAALDAVSSATRPA
jgi:hypothetical protein